MQYSVESVAAKAGAEIVFVDARVEGHETIIAGLSPGAEVLLIDPALDGLDQIAQALAGRSEVGAIHLVGHGDEGMLLLGASPLHAGNLAAYADDLAAIGQALTSEGDIHLWGCDVGAGEDGRAFLEALAKATGADVAASDDATGAGGDWNLEITSGEVAASAVFDTMALQGFDGTLATFTASTLAELRSALATAAANGQADTITILGNIAAAGSGDVLTSATDGHATLLDVNVTDGQTLEIVGGGFSLDANYFGRVLEVRGGTVEISGLTIRDGLVSGEGGSYNSVNGGDALGAGVLASGGILNLSGVTITGNRAAGGGAAGGGQGYSYGGGGGGGFAGVGGGDGGAYNASNPGGAGGAGSGGVGGSYLGASPQYAGAGGTAVGGSGSSGYTNQLSVGGAGGTAGTGGVTIGGGGGATASQYTPGPGAGGDAVGAIHIASGATVNLANVSITDNLAAGGGGAGSQPSAGGGAPGGAGGFGVGGVYVLGALNYQSSTVDLVGTDNGNYGAGGSGGGNEAGNAAGVAGAGGNTGGENLSGSGTINSSYAPNSAPTASNLMQTVSYTEDPGGSVALADIVVSDVDAGETITATLTLSDAAAGALTTGTFGSATSTYNAGTGVWTVSGSLSDVNAALAGVAFAPAANWSQDVTVATHVEDAAGAGPADGTITLDVTGVNDAPTATDLTQTVSYTEDPGGSVALGDIVVSDVDSGETITATLTLSDAAAGALTTGTFGSATSSYNAGTGVWTVTGSVSDVNAALAAVAFNPAANWNQDVTVTSRIRDAADTGPADGTITLDASPANDPPTATNLTQTVSYTEDPGGSVALADIVVSDIDAGETITATLTLSDAAAGALTTGSFGSATSTYNAGTGVWMVTGSVADVNAALAGVAFTPAANWDQDVTISSRIGDVAGTGPADGTITLDVTGANDAPTASNLTQTVAYTEDPGAPVALGDIVVSDVDSGETITATLTLSDAAAGVLTTGTFGSATPSYNAGTGVWTVTGSVTDVNAALASVAFTPAANWTQDITVTSHVEDAAGAGPPDGTITLDVTAANDTPTVTTSGGSATYVENAAATVVDGGLTVTDPDSATLSSATVSISGGFQAGEDTLAFINDGSTMGNVTGSYDAGSGVLTLTSAGGVATVAQWQAALRSVTYANGSEAPTGAGRTISVAVSDGVGTSSAATRTLTVTAVNDAPTTAPADGYVNTGAGAETGGLSVISNTMLAEGDRDDAGAGVTYTITTATSDGTLFVDANANDLVDAGEALGATATFTQDDIDQLRLKYLYGGGAGTGDSFGFSVADGGEDGAAALTGLSFAITVAERPVVAIGAGAPNFVEDAAAVAVAPNLTIADGDSANMASATVTVTDFVAGDRLTFTDQNGITGAYDDATGVLTLTGSATRTQYETALRSVTYSSTNDNPASGVANGDRAIAVTVSDGGLVSTAQTATVTVANANDAPTASNLTQTVSYTEDPGGSVALADIVVSDVDAGETITATLTLSDAAAGALTTGTFCSATSTYNAGTGVWTVSGSLSDVNAALAGVAFAPAANWSQDVTVATHVEDAAGAGPADGTITLDVTGVNDAPTGGVAVAGTAAQGETLTASHTLADSDGLGAITYQWQRADGGGWVDIAGATGATLSLTQADVGLTVRAVASYTDQSGFAESVASTATAAVANINDAPTGEVAISGVAQVGGTLSVTNNLADADGLGVVTYQWQAGGVDVGGATGTTFALTDAHLGKAITVVASYTDLLGTAETVTSAATAAVSSPPPPPPPTPPSSSDVVDGVQVTTVTGAAADGTPTQVLTIPIVSSTRQEQVGGNTVADIPLVTDGAGEPLLQAQVPTGLGLQVSGATIPKPAGSSLSDLIGEIEDHTTGGSQDQAQLTDAGSGFLQILAADAPLLVQTITPRAAAGAAVPAEGLVISGTPAAPGAPMTALVIDARGLPSGTAIQLHDVEFAALIGAVRVSGGQGEQFVSGDGASQYIVLGEGDDILRGGGGADTVGSAAGADQLFGDDGDDVVFGGDGDDVTHGNAGADTVSGDAGADRVYGGRGDDHVFGGADADMLFGDLGSDLLQGNAGRDTVNGGQGADTLHGGQDEDVLFGGADADLLFGDLGGDVLQGNAGRDTADGGQGADTLYGGQDEDVLFGGADGDLLLGDLGGDLLQGNAGRDTLHGGDGDDVVHGGQGDDVLRGDDGADTLSGDAGDDRLWGGEGADRFLIRPGGGADQILDFDQAEGDRLIIHPDLTYTLLQQGADTLIDFGGGDSVVLAGVQLASLQDGWLLAG